MFSGDNGAFYVFFASGPAGVLYVSDPDRETTVSMAMTALVAGRTVVARFTANGVDCNSNTIRGDMEGLWLK
jgi:hypothetical protein